MINNLPTIKHEAQVILGKSSSLIKITNKILANSSTALAKVLKSKQDLIIFFNSDMDTACSLSGKNIKLWKIMSGEEIPLYELPIDPASLSFSYDGKMFIVEYYNGNSLLTKIWDISTGKEIQTFNGKYLLPALSMPDGNTILSRSSNYRLALWEKLTGKEIRTFDVFVSFMANLDLSSDGRTALCREGSQYAGANLFSTVDFLDINSGEVIQTFKGDEDDFEFYAFSKDGKAALLGNKESGLKFLDISTGKVIRTFEGPIDMVRFITFSPDGKTVLSESEDGALKLWDINTGIVIRTFEVNRSDFYFERFSKDGKIIIGDGGNGTIKFLDIKSGAIIQIMLVFNDREWISITPSGYFDHSDNGRKYLGIAATLFSVKYTDDYSCNQKYRPNGLLRSDGSSANLDRIEINEDEIPF